MENKTYFTTPINLAISLSHMEKAVVCTSSILMKLSIIIPILNEAHRIPQLLEELKRFQQSNCEIIIVDGGSKDNSVEIAKHAGFRVEKNDSWPCPPNEYWCKVGYRFNFIISTR